MSIADTILQQMGGNRFTAMTGSKNYLADGKTLRMTLAKNQSGANLLYITLDDSDTYTMRFVYYRPGRFNKKTLAWSREMNEEITRVNGVFSDDLQRVFTGVTGMDTHL